MKSDKVKVEAVGGDRLEDDRRTKFSLNIPAVYKSSLESGEAESERKMKERENLEWSIIERKIDVFAFRVFYGKKHNDGKQKRIRQRSNRQSQ